MRIINDIIVHCTDTYPEQDWGSKEIDLCHRQRGFVRIGYHYVVKRDGTIEKGRPISMPGAHCKGHNAHSIGVVWVGGREHSGTTHKNVDNRTEAQKTALKRLLVNLCAMYRCSVHGHRDYALRECPCFDAKKEYKFVQQKFVVTKNFY